MKVYYYVDKNRTRQGPILVNDLVMFDVGPKTLVWCKGMDKWKHAEEVEELAFLFVTDESMKESIMDDDIGTSQEDMAPCDEGTQTPEEYGFNMPLIQCPECGNMISDKAVKCPKCGYPVGQVENSSPTHFNNDGEDYYPEKPSSSKWLYAVIGALAAGIVAMFLVLLLRKEDTPNTATVAERPLQETAAPETSSQDLVLEEPSTDKRDAIVRGIVNNMVPLNGGSFLMGATSEQSAGAGDDEWPVHNVTLSSFRIGRCEVTQEEWQAVMGNNPSRFRGARRPVDNVSWRDCQTFIKKLNDLSGKHFRLPTEAEWEFAARGGNNSRGYTYSGSNSVGSVAWYSATSGSRTHEVGSKSPNELGLYDMTGNLWEWCSDWYGSYDSDGQVDPTGPYSSSTRAIRGGGWNGGPDNCRVANRDGRAPGYRSDRLGLRLAMDE